MKKQHLFLSLIFAVSILCLSCKGKQGEPGPQGASFDPNQNYYGPKEGFAKGTATGNLLSGASYSYAYDFQEIWSSSDNYYKVNSPTETSISISKSYAGDGDVLVSGYFDMSFTVTSLTNLSSPTLESLSLGFRKDLGNNTFHSGGGYYSAWSSGVTATVSGLVYTSATGILTGNYTINAPADSYRGSLSVTNGTFSTKLSQTVTRKEAQ